MVDLASQAPLKSADGVRSPVSSTLAAEDDGRIDVSLRMAPGGVDVLEQIAKATHTSVDDVISKAFALYKRAVDAHREGKAIGIASSADCLETEFVGFEPPAHG